MNSPGSSVRLCVQLHGQPMDGMEGMGRVQGWVDVQYFSWAGVWGAIW